MALVELYLKGINLVNLDMFSQSDPQVRLYSRKSGGGHWREVARSETIDNNCNPTWRTTFMVPNDPSLELRFLVIDIDSPNPDLKYHDEIGVTEVGLPSLLARAVCTHELVHKGNTGRGSLQICPVLLGENAIASAKMLQVLNKLKTMSQLSSNIIPQQYAKIRKKKSLFTAKFALGWVLGNSLVVHGKIEQTRALLAQCVRVDAIRVVRLEKKADPSAADWSDTLAWKNTDALDSTVFVCNDYLLDKPKRHVVNSTATYGAVSAIAAISQAPGLPNTKRGTVALFQADASRPTKRDYENTDHLRFTPTEDGDPVVVAGSCQGLVRHLVHGRFADTVFRNQFLLTFPMFATVSEVLTLVIEAYLDPSISDRMVHHADKADHCSHLLRLRAVGVINAWMSTQWARDFAMPGCVANECDTHQQCRDREALRRFIFEHVPSADDATALTWGASLQKAFARHQGRKTRASMTAPPNICDECEVMQATVACEECELQLCAKCDEQIHKTGVFASHQRQYRLKASSTDDREWDMAPPRTGVPANLPFLECDPAVGANTLTAVQFALLQRVPVPELYHQKWAKDGKETNAPNIHACINHFNALSNLISSYIVNQPESKVRGEVIVKCIRLADACKKLHNYNAVMAITSALALSPINRLKISWKAVKDAKLTETWLALKDVGSPRRNFATLRNLLSHLIEPGVPYLGLFLSDLTFIEEGNPKVVQGGLINFARYSLAAKVIDTIQRFQSTAPANVGVDSTLETWLYCELQSYSSNEEVLYKLSLAREPRSRPPPDLTLLAEENVELRSTVSHLSKQLMDLEGTVSSMRSDHDRLCAEMDLMRTLLKDLAASGFQFPIGDSTEDDDEEEEEEYSDDDDDDVGEERDIDDTDVSARDRSDTAATADDDDDGFDLTQIGSVTVEHIADQALEKISSFRGQEGWLWKLSGSKGKAWDYRWANINTASAVMSYYESPDHANALKNIPLEGCKVMLCMNRGRMNCFQVYHPQRRIFYFCTASAVDTREWIKKLKDVIPSDADPTEDELLSQSGKLLEDFSSTPLETRPCTSFVDAPNAGWLFKADKDGKNWKKRWFVCTAGCLLYYKNDKGKKPIQVLPLYGYTTAFVNVPKIQHGGAQIAMATHFKNRTLYFHAEESRGTKQWMQVIDAQSSPMMEATSK